MKILLIPNTSNSALGIIARNIKKFWNHIKYPIEKLDINITPNITKEIASKYDILFPLYFLDAEKIAKIAPSDKIITGIHSHYIWDNGKTTPELDIDPPQELINKLKNYKKVNVVSKRLFNMFTKYMDVEYTRCGYDSSLFYPIKKQDPKKIIIGWCGNSNPKYHRNGKGFSEIIKPLTNLLDQNLYTFKFADSFKLEIPHQNMNHYYNQIDLLLIASKEEGQPMPPVEAAGCAIPTIATNVGIIPELIEDGISGKIINRNIESFKLSIENISKEELNKWGNEALQTAKNYWVWENVIDQWINLILN